MINTGITAVEGYVPEKVVTNDDLSRIVDTSDEWITSRTGIKRRHLSTGENTSQFCINIGKKLLEKTGTAAEDIDIIIVATITPDYATPSVSCQVQTALGCVNAFAFDISAACSGFVYSLGIADKFIKSGQYKKALVFGAETLSKITDWTDRNTCVLFGDGGGGALLEPVEKGGIIAEDLHARGDDVSLTGRHHVVENMVCKNVEKGHPYLIMDGRAIFNFATRVVPQSVNDILEKTGLTLEDIKYIVPHQANSRIIDIVARRLKTDIDKFYINVEEYGNTSAASIPIALSEMSAKGLLEKGDRIIITGFGAGLTWGSMLIEW